MSVADNSENLDNSANSVNLVAIAKTTKTRGLRGELIADILTDFPERFDDTENVTAVKSNGERVELELESFFFQKERVVLKFVGVSSIEAAESLVDCEICVSESETVALEDDAFFDWQLEGCAVETVDGETLGTVREVMRTGGTDILIVDSQTAGAKDFLIPFAVSICVEVDVENKRVKVDLPDGLLEF